MFRLNLIYLIALHLSGMSSFPDDVYNSEYRWTEEGDINIGAILSIHSSNSLINCTTTIQDVRNVQNVEALSFAVAEINKRKDLLPDLKLGFYILDDCLSPSMALARAIQFMPRDARMRGLCSSQNCNETDKKSDNIFYDVIGVIGTYTSKLSIIVANVLNLFKLPQISHTATSNVLSDKTRFPYFFRMVPPDRYQVMVISSLLRHFNWTHVSIVYSEGTYGREGVKELRHIFQTTKNAICIEDTIEIGYGSEHEDFLTVLETLNAKSTQVVIAFVEIEDALFIGNAVKKSGLSNRFTWIGSDSVSLILQEHPDLCQHFIGSIAVQPQSRNVDSFRKHLVDITNGNGINKSRNPWFHAFEQRKLVISRQENHTKKPSSVGWLFGSEDDYSMWSSFVDSFLIDSVHAFAYALDSVVKNHCLNELRKKNESISQCVQRVGLYNELKTINFNGSLGELEFNKDGDIMSKYDIRQCSSSRGSIPLKQIGYWDMHDEQLVISQKELSWNHKHIPVSSCPRPCTDNIGTIYYFTKQTCCWECVTCKVNEIVSANATRCEVCPDFYWPDVKTRTVCLPIKPVYFGLNNAVSVGLCTSAIVGILACLSVAATLIKYRTEHVIKCTSIELSFMILVGTILTYGLTGSFLSQPNSYKCYVNHVGFSLTFTIIYAPLLVKTNRIYRIFNSGRKTTRKPCFISKSSQILISMLLIFFQAAIVIISTSLEPPEVNLQMPSKTEEFVELVCNLPQAGLLSSLSYNLVLVVICTFYAFKTRKLPDNYKESRYIAYCVDTTLLIWITFVPTYFTTSRAAAKVTILGVSLLLNASVTVACLFIPRMYSLHQSLKNACSKNGHHYKDFRIVKHVVKRKRSLDPDPYRRVSSAVTITSDMLAQDYNDVIISVAQTTTTQTCLELTRMHSHDST